MPINRTASGLAVLAVLGAAPAVLAQSLDVYSYQGLLESGGQPAVGMFDIRFEIYDAAVGGNLLSTTSRVVTLGAGDGGLFTLSDLPNDAFATTPASGEWWIQIDVADVTLGPGIFEPLGERQFVTSPPTSGGVVLGVTMQAAFDGGSTIDMNGSLLELSDSTVGGGAFPILALGRTSTRGGGVVGYDELGSEIFSLVPDANGSGASFNLWGGLDGNVFIDGRQGADGSPRVYINGGRSSFYLDTSRTGDSSVGFPDDSIGPQETSSEPGIAGVITGGNDLGIAPEPLVLFTRSITVPGPGYIVAFLTGNMLIQVNSVATADATVDIVGPSGILSTARLAFSPEMFSADGVAIAGVAAHGAQTVNSAGEFDFFVQGARSSLAPTFFDDPNFTLLYVPTAYGFVDQVTVPLVKDGPGAIDPESVSAWTGGEHAVRDLERQALELQRRLDEQQQIIDRLLRERGSER